ncbi:histidyl-tRNA synthetase [Lentisphaera araneosa HTCC2155]|uniref:Histidine--tRNA ligase n=1 Tax=Lentisphaera araneosa HTCC2155 TaxID=313628 RepID=A6DRP8_9BACT|nr:histidine--tRNA ligase [Lentisphaera araneosa]EDM25717.1 histidyl-tRNA synthetase [Lentisphaera araneosa HTCC2155]
MADVLAKMMSGFPEWLPAAKRQEKRILDIVAKVYESYGFTPIETAAVEKVKSLATTGDVSKEIFGIHRLAGEGENKKAEFGLHFDLTLPTARYTADNFAKLQFPFKRYQIQKVWRGERPQKGRYREFYQADIDVIGDGTLPLHYEAEVVQVIYDIFTQLNIGEFTVKINNRKLLEGLYRQQDVDDMNATLIIVDKIDKIGKDEVVRLLIKSGLSIEQSTFCAELAEKKFSVSQALEFIQELDTSDELLAAAQNELKTIFDNLSHLPDGAVIFDLSIARGLDYYTGSVYECVINGLESYGSVCSGGRYDNLAEKFSKKKLPGVGLSIGISRLLYLLFENGRLDTLAPTPVQTYVVLFDESQRPKANKMATEMRANGINVEVAPSVKKFGKQIQFAEKRGAKFIVIPEQDREDQMKNLETGDQEDFSVEKMRGFLSS